MPVRSYLGAVSQELVGSCRRQAASEGSLSLTVASSLVNKRIRRDDEGRADHERAGKGGGGGPGLFARWE